jgi:hypothetical protein
VSSVLRSVSEIWRDTPALCALVPFDRVYMGRVPGTELYCFPYVSLLAPPGSHTWRTDKTRVSQGPLSFHVWVDDAKLEYGLLVAEAITDAYADRCWPIGEASRVLDCLDEGEPMAVQPDHPTVKAWEVVKLFAVVVERDRVDRSGDCCVGDGSYASDTELYSSDDSASG